MKVNQKKNAKGDCFQRAFHLLTEGTWKGQSIPIQFGRLMLRHGVVFHEETGYHIHGWVEDDVFAYDFISGKLCSVFKEQYYEIGKIEDSEGCLSRYTKREAMEKASETELYYFSNLVKQI